MSAGDATEGSPRATAPEEQQRLGGRLREGSLQWIKDIAAGVISTVVLAIVGMLLVQVGVASESDGLSLESFMSLLTPLEFWKSFSGLVVTWSQYNEWLLLGLGLVALGATAAVWWRRRGQPTERAPERGGPLGLLQGAFEGVKATGALGMLTALLLGAYGYQQYLWNVELPVPEAQFGVAFTRQVGSSVASEKLADYLSQMGHADQIQMRDLPVTFDARDTVKARRMAARIGADAVVIYREEGGDAEPLTSAGRTGLAAPTKQQADQRYVAYLVFADPSIGIEVPVAQEGAEGQATTVEYRTKGGVETPRLEATDIGRLMESAAGILLYDKDRYLPAIAHLRNAVSEQNGAGGSDGLVHYYLANSYYLMDQEAEAAKALDESIRLYEAKKRLSVQERLLLASAYTDKANILFYSDQREEAEPLLKKAVALREPLDKDQSALTDSNTFRRVHSTFGSAYLGLMQLAQYDEDKEVEQLWAGRARDSAKALLSKPDDDRARISGVWMTYRTGSCEDAYKLLQDMLREDPNDIYAHRSLARLASLRSGRFYNLESSQHVEAILAQQPDSLPELQARLQEHSLRADMEDPAYLEEVKALTDQILELDPNNFVIIEDYVSDVRLKSGWQLYTTSGSAVWPLGHAPTYERQRAELGDDPQYFKEVLAQIDSARPYAVRWSEEIQPDSAKAQIARVALSARAEFMLYTYLTDDGRGREKPNAELQAQYDPTWQRAFKEATRALETAEGGAWEDEVDARLLIAGLWGNRYWMEYTASGEKFNARTEEAALEGLKHAQDAAKLLEAHPPKTSDELTRAGSVYLQLGTAAVNAKSHYANTGQEKKAEEYTQVYEAALEGMSKAYSADVEKIQTQAKFLDREHCPSGQDINKGGEAIEKGNFDEAVRLLTEYTRNYPQDPEGMLSLGYARFRQGDLDAAMSSIQQFEQVAPDSPYGPANRAVILLAQRKPAEAQAAYAEMFKKLDEKPLGVRLQFIASAAADDLLPLVRDHSESRAGIAQVLPLFEEYLGRLPEAARTRHGALLVEAQNSLGAVALWAGEYEAAQRFLESVLQVNGQHVLANANLAIMKLAAGDAAGARAASQQAVAAASAYLQSPDGAPLEGDQLQAARKAARAELEAATGALTRLLEQKPGLAGQGAPILQQLSGAARQYE
ncbi:MAG: tetratricopeptide repeat protein [Chloroflexota bacterium]|nr:tetratricopeptide repeat protein [Chloroflexota bacterium]